MIKKRDNVYVVLLLLIIFLSERLFYIVDINFVNKINNEDLLLICCLFLILYVHLYKKNGFIRRKSLFKIIILFIPTLVILSSYAANYVYGQPMKLGIMPQRFMFLYFMYFPLLIILTKNEENLDITKKIILYSGLVISSLYIIQYASLDLIKFLSIKIDNRFGEVRLHYWGFIVYPSYYLILENINKKFKLKYVLMLIIELIFISVVIKARLVLVATIVTTLILIIVRYKKKLPIIVYILIWITLILSIAPNNILNEYATSIVSEISNNEGNYEVRNNAKQYYKEQIKDNLLLGNGFINTNWKPSYIGGGLDRGYYIADNGFIGVVFQYGLIGGFWTIILYLLMLKKSYLLYTLNKNISYLGISLFLIVTFINIPFLIMNIIPFIIILIISMLEVEIIKSVRHTSRF